MDKYKYLIILKNEDKTEQVLYFNNEENTVTINFGGKDYYYDKENTYIFLDPIIIDLCNKIVYHNGNLLYNIEQILDFGDKVKIFLKMTSLRFSIN